MFKLAAVIPGDVWMRMLVQVLTNSRFLQHLVFDSIQVIVAVI